MRGRVPDQIRLLVVDLVFTAAGAAIDFALPHKPRETLAVSIVRFIGQSMMLGGAAGAGVSVVDQGLAKVFPGQELSKRPIAVDVALGGSIAGLTVFIRHQHAREFGLVDPKRRAIKRAGLVKTAKASVAGVGAAVGMLTLAASEQFIAHKIKQVLNDRVHRFDIGSLMVGYFVALGMFGAAGTAAFVVATQRS